MGRGSDTGHARGHRVGIAGRRFLLLLGGCAGHVAAQTAPMCADRPGKATPSCVMAPGTVQVEVSAVDRTRARSGRSRADAVLIGDTLLKYGIAGDTELRLGFTPYVRDRTRDDEGKVTAQGFGDVALSFRHRVTDGGDAGISVAVQPTVTLPVGSGAVSDGMVTGNLTVPVDVPLPGGWSLNVSPALAAVPDADGRGRHASVSGVAALSHAIGPAVAVSAELFAERDRDPAGGTTQATVDFLVAWQPADDWQLDLSSYVGLTGTTPDLELIGGFTFRF